MKVYNFEQGSDEWHKVRAGKFTASDFHMFFGNSNQRKSEIIKKAKERVTGRLEETTVFMNEHMERGKRLESEARRYYELEKECEVAQVGFVEMNEFIGCSPDGVLGDKGGMEIKCPSDKVYELQRIKGVAGIKPSYLTQIQYNIMVLIREWWDYVAYNPNFKEPLYVARIYRNETAIKTIKEAIDRGNNEINEIIKKEI